MNSSNVIRTVGFAAALSLALMAQAVKADTITTLYNTGVVTQSTLNTPSSVDQHYTISAITDQSGNVLLTQQAPYVAANTTTYPWNSYTSGTPTSQWISFSPSGNAGNTDDIYDYQTTFSIGSQYNALSAVINGVLAADDGAMIYLNGKQVTNEFGGYTSLTSFTISKGFQMGTNTLDFVVDNAGYFGTGLQVNMTGTVTATPEPSAPLALGIGLLGLLGLGLATKSRRRTTSIA